MPQFLNQHLKLHHLHFTEINELYISLSLQAFSAGLVGIFVPIYLYNLGFSITKVCIYFILLALTRALIQPLTTTLIMKYGPKHILMCSYIILFFYMLMLYFIPTIPFILYITAAVGAFATTMFWTARHTDLATITTNSNTTHRFSVLLIFSAIAQALAPFIGGVIASGFGIEYALIGASIGLLIAVIPLFKTPEPVVPKSSKKIRIFLAAPVRHIVANFAINAQGIVGILLWPFFIFLIVQTYQDVGIISTASLVLVVILLFSFGHLQRHDKNHKILRTGSNLRSGVHLGRMLAQSFPMAMGINILGDLTDTLVSVPYATRFYQSARKYGIHAYLVDMEIAACLAHAAMWVVLLIANYFFGLKIALIVTFILAALLMPLLRLIEPQASSKNV